MKKRKTNNKKGFIGAIGDDLPSLIPIFLGLLIFFSVFLNTYNVYKRNTDVYSLQNEAINIATTMKEEPLVADYNSFQKTCGKINTKVNWNAFLVPLDLNILNYETITKANLSEDSLVNEVSQEGDFLTYNCNDLDEFLNHTTGENVIIYMFPLTLQRELYVVPVRLYVVAWE